MLYTKFYNFTPKNKPTQEGLTSHLKTKETDGLLLYMAKSLILRFFKDDIGSSAAALSYYLLFSFFPFLIFLNLLLAQFNISGPMLEGWGQAFLPKEVLDLATRYLRHLSSVRSLAFLIVGLFVALYSITRAVNSLNGAINRAYRITEPRPAVAAYILSGVLTIFLFVMVFLSFILITLGGRALEELLTTFPFLGLSMEVWAAVRWGSMGTVYLLTLCIFYYSMPYMHISFRSVLPGAITAGVGLIVASFGFSVYVDYIASFSVVYGSLGAIIVFMLWLYITSTIMIIGGELNHSLLCYKKRKG